MSVNEEEEEPTVSPESMASLITAFPGSTDGVEAKDALAERGARFALLVSRHSSLMYRVALSLLRHPHDAEDAVQEAFLKLYRGNAWQHMQDEKAFLARTVWRVALDRLPKLTPHSLDDNLATLVSIGDSPETAAIRSARSALLRRLIDALPLNLRQVLVLSAIEELNSREIATLLGIPEGTVRTRLMRARDELKRRFEAIKGGNR